MVRWSTYCGVCGLIDDTCYNTPTNQRIPPVDPNTTSTTQKYNPPFSSPNQLKHQIPSPHQYHTLICDNNRAKLQQKNHDHLVHDTYCKKKQKREKRILISFDGNSDSDIPTKDPPVFMNPSPIHQYSCKHKDNILYHTYCKKKNTLQKYYITTE